MTPEETTPTAPAASTAAVLRAAARLDELAARGPSAQGSQLLHRIAAEAKAGGSSLAGIDLVRAYPPELLMPDQPAGRGAVEAVLGGVRDAAVFVPIAVTWFSLWKAFEDFEDSPKGTNFLRLWISGLGGTAVLAVIALIVVVVVLTAVLQRREWTAERHGSREWERQEVAGQLMLINLELSTSTAAQAATLPAAKLVRAARDISAAAVTLAATMKGSTERLAKIFEPGPESSFTTALDRWTASAGELREMGRSLTVPHDLIRRFTALRAELAAEEQAARAALKELLTELGEASQSSRDADVAHTRVAASVVEGTRQVALGMELFVDHSERLYEYMDVLARVLAVLDGGRMPTPSVASGMTNATTANGAGDGPMGRQVPRQDTGQGHDGGTPPRTPPAGPGSTDSRKDTGDDGGVADGWYPEQDG
ncbi:hypothetical protein GTW40_28195 [Streptomyces sp. SID4985]|uniref:hypothetical protein n=1 Tax=Streptomyces sp. SID4985 TaxID=2690292 RepID=UPI001368B1EC|nr:hypothetical protein [Streptomyces sp. SID4985]MYQ48865.1 hypothetical protein [Streptomyces sp. SID4985]